MTNGCHGSYCGIPTMNASNRNEQNSNKVDNMWFFNTKMTQHMIPHKEWLNSYKLLDKPLTMYMGDD
jgi:hypothetical protein